MGRHSWRRRLALREAKPYALTTQAGIQYEGHERTSGSTNISNEVAFLRERSKLSTREAHIVFIGENWMIS